MDKEVKESFKKVKKLEKSQQEAKRTCDDALKTLQGEREAANKKLMKAVRERDESTKHCMEVAQVVECMNVESLGKLPSKAVITLTDSKCV